MSVRKGDRTQGKLQVLTLASNLCTYTIGICKSEKCFPKAERWLFTSKIADEAIGAYTCIRKANSILVGDGPTADVDYRQRHMYQVEAHCHINALLGLIDIAYQLNSIEQDKIRYWTQLATDTNDKLKAWMRSDKERFTKK